MSTNPSDSPLSQQPGNVNTADTASGAARRNLPPAAQRALAEAAERRALRDSQQPAANAATELGGREGPDPVRYGDWENKGIVSDF